jgi:tRNA threonylcarbamoyladenosine biosynthesis protein TsaB
VENRLVLAIDNSIDFLNIALSLEQSLLEERRIKSTFPPSQVLPGHVSGMLAGHGYTVEDLSLVAVTLGPGSFTGMRVAVAFSKGIATGRAIPLIGVPTLDVLASPFSFMEGYHILPLIDAKKGEIFTALYRVAGGSVEKLSDYRAVKPGETSAIVRTPCVCFGTGARLAEDFLAGMEGVTLIKDAFSAISGERLIKEALKGAADTPAEEVQPIYGRRSEAEIKFNVAVT